MKIVSHFLSTAKDGGPDSPVDAYFVIEMKWLFTIALLKFNKGARESFHTHAFNAFTWFISGSMLEEDFSDPLLYRYTRSLLPKFTPRLKNHRVIAEEDSWCFTIRGPWCSSWTEDHKNKTITLTHGRKVIDTQPRGVAT